MPKFILSFCFLLTSIFSFSQVNPSDVEIVRDSYGVPHIFGEKDIDVAYGLAWAHCEDDFNTIQLAYLAGNAKLSKYFGLKGASVDFVSQLIGSSEIVEEEYETKIDAQFKKILEAYVQGMNRYAELNPKKVLYKGLFPVTPKKILKYAQLQLFVSSDGDSWVRKIVKNELHYEQPKPKEEITGSNSFAFNSKKTTDGNVYFAINTHQPLEGPVSWYETHLVSKEGLNVIGSTFAGAPVLLCGVNQNLGWGHTVNRPDKTDVFLLEMHPSKKKLYKVDDVYLKLEEHKAKMTLKILGIPITVSKKYYKSIYGPTIKNKSGYYAVRTPSLYEIRALEQWWKMGKTKNFTEFYNTIKMKALPGYNIGYADRNDTIFYISNGLIPKRAKGYDWKNVVLGNTRKNLWTETYAIEELPQVLQPSSGYFYNANHSPFFSTDSINNPKMSDFSPRMNFEQHNNNRSTRLKELIDSYDKVSYSDFKRIKYDNQLPQGKLNYTWTDINELFELNASQYPEVKEVIEIIQQWDRKADANSYGAGVYLVFYNKLKEYYKENSFKERKVPTSLLIKILKRTKAHLQDYFGKTKVQLGEYQKLVHGKKELPIFGIPDVLTAMHSAPYKKGKVRVFSGESYIELVKFIPDGGVEIESIMSYGNSENSDSPHFDDQMELYSQFKTKKMTFDKEEIYKNAETIYHPK